MYGVSSLDRRIYVLFLKIYTWKERGELNVNRGGICIVEEAVILFYFLLAFLNSSSFFNITFALSIW